MDFSVGAQFEMKRLRKNKTIKKKERKKDQISRTFITQNTPADLVCYL